MKMRLAALAAVATLSSAGCTALKPGCGDACGDSCGGGLFGGAACHVSTSQFAPRASLLQGRCPGGIGVCDRMGWTQKGCASGCVGCGDGCGPFQGGCCGCGGAGCNNCLNSALSSLLDCDGCGGCGDGRYGFQPGPPVGQVAYPYYTTRGPRDFLMCNPPSIGPR